MTQVGRPTDWISCTPAAGVICRAVDVRLDDGPTVRAYDMSDREHAVSWHHDSPQTGAQVADALGITRFAAMGASAGGPHALACAALLGDRVTGAVGWPGSRRAPATSTGPLA
jgi:pimeloyl-ACP methyl ester carboxylesterase